MLAAVFVPTAFLGGITGQFFRQFAVTIAVATVDLLLRLADAVAGALRRLILKSRTQSTRARHAGRSLARPVNWFFGLFNRGFDRTGATAMAATVRWATASAPAVLAVYVGADRASPSGRSTARRAASFRQQDRGYVIVSLQLPGGSSLARTTEVVRRAERDHPRHARHGPRAELCRASTARRSRSAPNAAALFPVFATPIEERLPQKLTAEQITADLRTAAERDRGRGSAGARRRPRCPGIGNGGGFAMRLQDRAGRGTDVLAAATDEMVNAARADAAHSPRYSPRFPTARRRSSSISIARRAQMLDVPIANVTEALETYFGSAYVNDFNILGRTYRVTAQADLPVPPRARDDLTRLKTRNDRGRNGAARQRSLQLPRHHRHPIASPRYNLYPASEIARRARPRHELDHGAGHHDTSCPPDPAGRLRLRVDATCPTRRAKAATVGLYIFPLCVLFVYPRTGRAIWQLDAAARHHPDRADVPVCRHRSASGSWRRTSTC